MKSFLLALIALFSTSTFALSDIRCCKTIERDANGRITRSAAVVSEFVKLYPCPSTGLQKRSCKGWAVDHVIPRACGGADTVENLQWLPREIKSRKGVFAKDRWERKIYCKPANKVSLP